MDDEALKDAVRRRRSWNIFFLPLVTKIDLFIKRIDPFDESELDRRRFIQIGPNGQGIYVATAEDIVLRKLSWFRDGGEVSMSQWRDILGVIAVSQTTIDQEYLVSWARRHGVEDLLNRAFSEAHLKKP